MKRLFMLAALILPLLCLSGCKKPEKAFIGVWSYEEGQRYRDYYFCSLNLKDNGNVDFNQTKSDRYGEDRVYLYGTWSVVNDEQITCYMTDEDGDRESWTFRLTSPNCLYWVGESLELHHY